MSCVRITKYDVTVPQKSSIRVIHKLHLHDIYGVLNFPVHHDGHFLSL